MFQRKEIGKYRSSQSQIDARLNRECVTPDGDHYVLIDFSKNGRNKLFTYQWVEHPEHKALSHHLLSLEEIVTWINELKSQNI